MKYITSVVLEQPLHTKLSTLSSIKKNFFGEKDMTLSKIVNIALEEYFINHDEEIKTLMDNYHSQGGCAEL